MGAERGRREEGKRGEREGAESARGRSERDGVSAGRRGSIEGGVREMGNARGQRGRVRWCGEDGRQKKTPVRVVRAGVLGWVVERRGAYFCSRLRRKRFISRTPKPLAPFG